MGNVIVGLSVSLDGFVAGADDGVDSPLGTGGDALFRWITWDPTRSCWNRPRSSHRMA